MTTTLEVFGQRLGAAWGPLSSGLVETVRREMEALLATPPTEAWLADLHREAPANQELHRDAEHGFVLLAHTEQAGLYRPPHDHGRGWVIYGLQRGELEIGTYARVQRADGEIHLVKREATVVRAGEAKVYCRAISTTHCACPKRQPCSGSPTGTSGWKTASTGG